MLKIFGFKMVHVRDRNWSVQFLAIFIALFVAFVISGVFISQSGADPIVAYKELFYGSFGSKKQILETLLRSAPLLLTALATVITFRAQIWSIGQEGQLLAGAMMSYLTYDIFSAAPKAVLIPLVILAGFIGGGILASIAGMMKAWAKVDIIISTVMLNFIVTNVLSMLLYDHKFWMGEGTYYPRTSQLTENAYYPTIFSDSRLHIGFIIAIILAIILFIVLKKTPYGYDIRAFGTNPSAAKFRGINISKLIIVTMFISGGLAGLAGTGEVFGVHHLVSMDISPGYGYTGIIVAMVAELNPLATILVAVLFGGLINGSVRLITAVGTHTSIIYVIQAFILLCILAGRALTQYRLRKISHD